MIGICNDCYYGHVYGIVLERKAYLSSLFVKPIYRTKGYARGLLKYFLANAMSHGAIYVELDDCSDNYRKSHNIYLKYGFEYINKEHLMRGNIRNILKKLKLYA